MEFDVFDKLSELETKVQYLRSEIESKNSRISDLEKENKELRRSILNGDISSNLSIKDVSSQEAPPGTLIDLESKSDLLDLASGKSIAEALKETSETVTQCTGYVYDSKTGLYYDQISGYYYDPENQLFYEPRTGVYYSYNSETREYSYHSRVNQEVLKQKYEEIASDPAVQHAVKKSKLSPDRHKYSPRSRSRSRSSSRGHRRRHSSRDSGRYKNKSDKKRRSHRSRSRSSSRSKSFRRRRLSESDDDSRKRRRSRSKLSKDSERSKTRRSSKERKNDLKESGEDIKEQAQRSEAESNPCVAAKPVIYPPCVRLVVLSSKCLPIGRLAILTSSQCLAGWGCLGSCSSTSEAIQFEEDEVLPIHCEVIYSRSEQAYFIKDRKSKSGTFVNGTRLNTVDKTPLRHSDILRIGSTRLLVHIHSGRETCAQCEVNEHDLALDERANGVHSTLAEASSPNTIIEPHLASLDPETAAAVKLIIAKEEELSQLENSVQRDAKRKAKLNELKIKYGLKGDAAPEKRIKGNESTCVAFSTGPTSKSSAISISASVAALSGKYIDRAAQRRARERSIATASAAMAAAQTTATLASLGLANPEEVAAAAAAAALASSATGGAVGSADDNVDDGFNDTGLGLPRDLPPGIHLVLPKPPPPPASLTTPLGEENKGAQLLAKMGWRAGEGLGKDKSGIAEPVAIGRRINQHAGLGLGGSLSGHNSNVTSIDATPSELEQARRRATTLERYKRLEEKCDS